MALDAVLLDHGAAALFVWRIAMPVLRHLSRRAVQRLRIAAALMHVHLRADPTEAQCEHLLRRIEALVSGRREILRGCVDWVEAYEAEEAAASGSARAVAIDRSGGQGAEPAATG